MAWVRVIPKEGWAHPSFVMTMTQAIRDLFAWLCPFYFTSSCPGGDVFMSFSNSLWSDAWASRRVNSRKSASLPLRLCRFKASYKQAPNSLLLFVWFIHRPVHAKCAGHAGHVRQISKMSSKRAPLAQDKTGLTFVFKNVQQVPKHTENEQCKCAQM